MLRQWTSVDNADGDLPALGHVVVESQSANAVTGRVTGCGRFDVRGAVGLDGRGHVGARLERFVNLPDDGSKPGSDPAEQDDAGPVAPGARTAPRSPSRRNA
ncbi:hypothetical protein ABIA38_005539 [Embleya sp. AB8]